MKYFVKIERTQNKFINKFEVNELYKPNYHDLGPGMKPHKWYGTSFNIGNFNSEDRTAFIKYPYELLVFSEQ